MSHNIESMFYTDTATWHGLGNRVEHATSQDALTEAGLNWNIIKTPI